MILALSTCSSPPGVTRRYRFSPGLVEIFPRSSPRFITVITGTTAICCGTGADGTVLEMEIGEGFGAERSRSRTGSASALTIRASATAWASDSGIPVTTQVPPLAAVDPITGARGAAPPYRHPLRTCLSR